MRSRLFICAAAVIAAVMIIACLCACGNEAEPAPETTEPVTAAPETTSPSGGAIVVTQPSDDTGEPDTTAPDTTAPESEPPATSGPDDADTTAPDPVVPSENDATPTEVGAAISQKAQELIGTEYEYGGVGPDTFDNSGFVYYVCRESGVKVPRLARDMAETGTSVGRDGLAPGDIAIFSNEIGGDPDFVGIYVGDGKFVACNNPDTPTKLQKLDSGYWSERFISGRRVG